MYLQLAESPRRRRGGKEQVLITKYKRESNRVPEHWRTLNEEDMFLAKRTKPLFKKPLFKKPLFGGRNPLKVALLAPGRGAFIGMLDLNIDGLATRLSKGDVTKLGDQWLKLGGDRNKLIKALNKGAKKKPKKLNILNKLTGKKGMSEDEFLLAQRYYPMLNDDATDENPAKVTGDEKAKIIAVCTGAATAIGGLIAPPAGAAIGAAGPMLGAVVIGLLPMIRKGADIPEAEAELPPTSEIPEPPVDGVPEGVPDADGNVVGNIDTKAKIMKYLPYVAVGVVAVVGGYFLLKRKK
jgi:hypothetical protein